MWSLMCKSTLLVNAECRHRSILKFSNQKHSSVLIRKRERTTIRCKDILPGDTALVQVFFEVINQPTGSAFMTTTLVADKTA